MDFPRGGITDASSNDLQIDQKSDSTSSAMSLATLPTTTGSTPGLESSEGGRQSLTTDPEKFGNDRDIHSAESKKIPDLQTMDESETKPGPLTIDSIRELMVELVKDTNLDHISYDEDIGNNIKYYAMGDVNRTTSLVAYINYLEKVVASSTKDCSSAKAPDDEKSKKGAVTWKLDVQRWKIVHDRYDNQETIPDDKDLDDDVETSKKSNGHILYSYRIYNKERRHTSTKLEIFSPLLIDILRDVISPCADETYDALLSSLNVYIFSPYAIILNNRRRLQDHANVLEGSSKDHLMAFLNFVKDELPDANRFLNDIENGEVGDVSYDVLWLLYPPGSIVYSLEDEEWCAYKISHVKFDDLDSTGVIASMTVVCEFQHFDASGSELIEGTTKIVLYPFKGRQPIESMRLIPQKYHSETSKIQQLLVERGRKYYAYRGKAHLQEYIGGAWPTTKSGSGLRVMIDNSTSSGQTDPCSCRRCESHPDYSHTTSHNDKTSRFPEFSETEKFLCCQSRLKAFSLLDKTWEEVKISELRAVQFREDAFRRLVIKGEHKVVVKAMVRSYLSKETSFGDLVKGKGLGLVLLLHGSPGTGKTLTAECVAEKEQRPIYMVTCGDLGTEPDELERKLKEVFTIAVNWKAILLLDEADVFLQERDVHDLKRNALVSVFLRELEYFNGILFLTTNRPGYLDEAFQSRIHITLGLPELDKTSRLKVWGIFVQELKISDDEKKAILRFLREKSDEDGALNGRQIRNAVRTAIAIAEQDDRKAVSIEHIEKVLAIGRDFTKYLKEVNRLNQEQRAASLGYRSPVTDQEQKQRSG